MARPKTYRVKKGKHYPIKRRSAPGAAPGTLIADPEAHELEARVITYSGETFEEVVDAGIEKIREIRFKSDQVLWLDIVGLRDVAFIQQIGELFGLHRLALEDVINLHQRPKVEEYNDYFFVTARTLLAQKGNETEQVSFFLGKNFLVSFQEKKGDCFEPLRKRLREGKGLIRETKEDHLLYALLDAIIDNYFPALERIGEELEVCEDAVITNPEPSVTQRLHSLKRNLLTLRRAIWPQREMLNALIRDDSPLIRPQTHIYLRDCYDHVIQLMDMIETYREIASGLLDIYLSSISNRMNEIMKVLTIIATIFIPLSFITGLYGMNFNYSASHWNMPELNWRYGYPFALMLMIFTAVGLLYYFKRKGWLGGLFDKKDQPKE